MNYPISTYRVQLHSKFTLKDLEDIIPYLEALGLSTIYASPIGTATQDSMHGYDVADANLVNPQIGTLEALRYLAQTLQQKGMSWLQDIVPNHMAFAGSNLWLMDVLERGRFSPYYNHFDIDWEHPDLQGKVLLPVLDKELKACLHEGDLTLDSDTTGFKVKYGADTFPLSVSAWPLLTNAMKASVVATELIETIEHLGQQAVHNSLEQWAVLKRETFEAIWKKETWTQDLKTFFAKVANDAELMRKLLEAQVYRLGFWKLCESQMNYRRFFTINSLICLRMEDKAVFDDYHRMIGDLYREGLVQGLRIDHIDGLLDPKAYVSQLRALLGRDCYLIAEKILAYEEPFPADWDLEGTSGYEFLAYVNRVLTDGKGAQALISFYKAFTDECKPYQELVFEKKRAFLYNQMRGELQNLIQLLQDLHIIDTTTDIHALKKALALFMAAFPVYRIYPEHLPLAEADLLYVHRAIHKAQAVEGGLDQEFGLIKSLFGPSGSIDSERKLTFIKRLMQFTGPLAAKGVEDTTFYVYSPLISHNEVGDAPDELSISIEEFHQQMQQRQKQLPYSLNATSTHDTKRGEDARMRINAIAVLHEEWTSLVKTWHSVNQPFIKMVDHKPAPSLNDEYFVYQSLLGSFPEDFKVDDSFKERTRLFLIKALREAKVHTTYTEPNEAYEETVVAFALGILDKSHSFMKSFGAFLEKIIPIASHYSLVQTVLKITAPGIPDFYQGTELLDVSYVDPDNRRPVDYQKRKQALADIKRKEQESFDLALSFVKERKAQGFEKLYATYKLLPLRKELSSVFLEGDYRPVYSLMASGKVISFIRSYRNEHVWVIIPLYVDVASGVFVVEDVRLEAPEGLPVLWTNVFSQSSHTFVRGQALPLQTLLAGFPVAVLRG